MTVHDITDKGLESQKVVLEGCSMDNVKWPQVCRDEFVVPNNTLTLDFGFDPLTLLYHIQSNGDISYNPSAADGRVERRFDPGLHLITCVFGAVTEYGRVFYDPKKIAEPYGRARFDEFLRRLQSSYFKGGFDRVYTHAGNDGQMRI